MPPVASLRSIILEKAILLFGERGFHGVTTEELATAADVNEASLFQYFESKERLYRAAVIEVSDHSERALGAALLDIYARRQDRDPRQFAFEVLRLWYVSLPQPMMRLLQQVLIANPDSHDEAYAPIGRVINIVDAVLEGKTRRSRGSHAQESAELLVSALFQYKVVLSDGISEKEEMAAVSARITHWLDDLFVRKQVAGIASETDAQPSIPDKQ